MEQQTSTQFKSGQVPWNKGKKGIHLSPSSEWKKGVYNPTSRNKINRVEKKCAFCGTVFTVKGSLDRIQCCSRSCASRLRFAKTGKGPRKGAKLSEETRAKQRVAKLGIRGPEHWNYKNGGRSERRKAMARDEYIQWRKAVFQRDSFTCQHCKQKNSIGGQLNAHHIKSWAKFPDLRFELSNGLTLCEGCHHKVHPEVTLFRKKRKV